MGIFNHHHATSGDMNETPSNFHMSDENKNTSEQNTTHNSSNAASHEGKSACGCGCANKTKGLDEEVVEIKEEWDY